MTQESRRAYMKKYREKNRVRLYRQALEDYFPRSIHEIAMKIPGEVERYYKAYPFEKYGEPFIQKRLRQEGICPDRQEYQDCYAAASDAYLYSIHRCALCGYTHVEPYIKKMISRAIVWRIVISREEQAGKFVGKDVEDAGTYL